MTRHVIDFGNGFVKYMQNGCPVSFPAAIAPIYDRAKFSQANVFEYREGVAAQITNGTEWIAGFDAIDFAPSDAIRVGNIPQSGGKARYGLQLLVSTLEPVDQEIDIICSVPNPLQHGEAIKRALRGTHQLLRNSRAFSLTIRDVDVRPEGYGAVYGAIVDGLASPEKINIGLDFGFQTLILTAFNARGVEMEQLRTVVDTGGCASLYSRIASHSEMAKAFGGEICPSLVEDAIKSTPHSPELDGFRFESIFRQVKGLWLNQAIEKCRSVITDIFPRVGSIVVFGGGANLVKEEVSQLPKTIVLENPQLANVQGLARLPQKVSA